MVVGWRVRGDANRCVGGKDMSGTLQGVCERVCSSVLQTASSALAGRTQQRPAWWVNIFGLHCLRLGL